MGTSTREILSHRPKLLLMITLIVFSLGYILLITIEGMSLIDAFYFLIVTISTVGFGDITPTQPITKLVVTLMIITGISTLALVSERLVDRLIQYNTSSYLALPQFPLDYSGHILIVGYSRIAANIAILFQGRFYRVVIIDPSEERVIQARNNGFEAYLGHADEINTLQQINLKEANALYLFLEDENTNVITSIQARSISNDILIFASTDHELSIELGILVGINRTYHYERIVASNVSVSLKDISALILPNQTLSQACQYVIILASNKFQYKEYFPSYYPLGFLDSTFTSYSTSENKNIDEELNAGKYLLFAVSREEFRRRAKDRFDEDTIIISESDVNYDKIIVGGYNATAKHVIDEIDPELFENYKFEVFTFSESEANRAKKDGIDVVYCSRSKINEVLPVACTDTTLMVNLFDKITDSLLVNTMISDLELNVHIIQLAFNRVEVDVFKQSNVSRILIPDILMSRGMFLIYLATKKLINSLVWGDAHIFEHKVDDTDPLIGKDIKDLKKQGYEVVLYDPKGKGNAILNAKSGRITIGDILIFKRSHQFLVSKEIQIIDQTAS